MMRIRCRSHQLRGSAVKCLLLALALLSLATAFGLSVWQLGENKSVIGYSSGGYRRMRPTVMRAPGEAALKLLVQGRWKPIIGGRFPLDQAAQAHHMVEDRESIGKVLLIP